MGGGRGVRTGGGLEPIPCSRGAERVGERGKESPKQGEGGQNKRQLHPICLSFTWRPPACPASGPLVLSLIDVLSSSLSFDPLSRPLTSLSRPLTPLTRPLTPSPPLTYPHTHPSPAPPSSGMMMGAYYGDKRTPLERTIEARERFRERLGELSREQRQVPPLTPALSPPLTSPLPLKPPNPSTLLPTQT